jgi:multiple sugar transport system substrate-binding protein
MLTPVNRTARWSPARRRPRAVAAIGLTALITLVACSKKDDNNTAAPKSSPSSVASPAASSGNSATSSAPASSSAPESSAAGVASPKGTVTWFVGLGAGTDKDNPAKQQKIVDAFNASQSDVKLKLQVVIPANAAKQLATEIAGGNGPDIVGPVGVKGSNQFEGQWADLKPLMESQKFDTSSFDPGAIKAFEVDGKQVGLPTGVFPSFVWYNKDLFDEAGLAYPPAKFGDKYADGSDWNWDKLQELAKKLTLDSAGKDATDPAFNKNKVVQWGYDPQFSETDLTRWSAQNGAGSFVADDKKTAQIPEQWLKQWKRRHDMIYKDFSSPTKQQLDSDTLNKGNPFPTGKMAMVTTHLWYTCCASTGSEATKDLKPQTFWDIAAMPANDLGKITAPLHSDTFRILDSSKNKEAAFKALSYLVTTAGKELGLIYGAMPPSPALQDEFFATLDKTYTQKPNWQVAKDALAYADVPNHEAWTPNFAKADERIKVTATNIYTDPNLDVDAEAAKLKADLQKIFDAAPAK